MKCALFVDYFIIFLLRNPPNLTCYKPGSLFKFVCVVELDENSFLFFCERNLWSLCLALEVPRHPEWSLSGISFLFLTSLRF